MPSELDVGVTDKHVVHVDNPGCIPLSDVAVERSCVVKHVVHVGNPGHVPLRDVAVEHAVHVGRPGHVPLRDVAVEFTRPGNRMVYYINEKPNYVGHSRETSHDPIGPCKHDS